MTGAVAVTAGNANLADDDDEPVATILRLTPILPLVNRVSVESSKSITSGHAQP